MAGCSADSFSNVSAAAFDCLVRKAAKYGVTIDSDSGSDSASGFTIGWNYDRAGSSLTIQCLTKPGLISCNFVKKQVKEQVQDCIDNA